MNHTTCEDSSMLLSLAYEPVDERMEARYRCSACKGKEPDHPEDPKCNICGGDGFTKGTYSYANVPADRYARIRDAGKDQGKLFRALVLGNPKDHPHTLIPKPRAIGGGM